jgi:nucleotide-binding universal stress UspA family protein
MNEKKKILIGYDGSEYANFIFDDLKKAGLPDEAEAVVFTAAEAWELPAMVDRVSSGTKRFVHPTVSVIERHLSEISGNALKIADAAAAKIMQIFPGWNVKTEASCGKAAAELIKKADEWEPDLIVIGSQGLSALGRLILGSVSQKVLYEARCPVRIARKGFERNHSAIRVLIAVDGSRDSEITVNEVARRRWSADTEFRIIAVDDPFSRPEAGYISWDMTKDEPVAGEESTDWIRKVIDAPVDSLKSRGLNVSTNIRWGDAANMILDEAKEWQADSIFLGARGLSRFKRFLVGSVSSTVAAKAPCSVEVVRKKNKHSNGGIW